MGYRIRLVDLGESLGDVTQLHVLVLRYLRQFLESIGHADVFSAYHNPHCGTDDAPSLQRTMEVVDKFAGFGEGGGRIEIEDT